MESKLDQQTRELEAEEMAENVLNEFKMSYVRTGKSIEAQVTEFMQETDDILEE